MKDTEKFLRSATRGLWGQAKKDAAMELRGAVEDKIYRYTLLGMTETEAERAALRDLGSPAAIARELGVVHSVPQGAKVALFVALAGALGLQAAAQIPAVRAMPTPVGEYRNVFCDFSASSIASLAKVSPKTAQYKRQEVKRLGSAAKAQANCIAMQRKPNRYLRLSDLLAALKAGGVEIVSESNRLVTVKLANGEIRSAEFGADSRIIDGEAYISKFGLLPKLLNLLDGPARLSGSPNPVLSIGTVKVQLGTPETPLATGDILASQLEQVMEWRLQSATPPQTTDTFQPVQLTIVEDVNGVGQPDMTVSAPDGTLYAVLATWLQQDNPYLFGMGIAPVQQGKLPQPIGVSSTGQPLSPRIVRTPAELVQAAAKHQHAALLYRLDTSDLRNIKYLPVAPGEVKLLKASWQK